MPYTTPSAPADPQPAPETTPIEIRSIADYVRELRIMKTTHGECSTYHQDMANDLENKIKEAIAAVDQVSPEIAAELRKI